MGILKRHLGVEDVVVEVVFHAQHFHVCTQRHLAHAVAVEVELVLLEVLKVLHHRQQLLQRLRACTRVSMCDRLQAMDRSNDNDKALSMPACLPINSSHS